MQLGLGDGRFGDATTLAFPSGIFPAAGGNTVAAVDVDGNGTADIVVSQRRLSDRPGWRPGSIRPATTTAPAGP